MSSVSIFEKNKKRRVVVTGIGAITPAGLNLEDSWSSLIQGRSSITQITRFNTDGFDCKIAGEVKNFDPAHYIEKKEIKKLGRFIQLGLAAAQMAITDSGIDFKSREDLCETTGVIVGVGMGGLEILQDQIQTLTERGPSRVSPFFIPSVISNLASGQISIYHGLKGANYSVTSACASGCHSIGEATKLIQSGASRVMLAGGSESALCESGIAGFSSMKALSTRNDQPEAASRPWDKDRDGFVMAEGASILVLEDLEHAQHRGAFIYGEVLGYGATSDAYHITKPSETGEGATQAMVQCLRSAEIHPDQVDYINAHGTSTPTGDALECLAIERAFGAHAQKVWVSSTKSMIGHGLGAAGAMESAFCLMALKTNIAPPTINIDNPSDDCNLDFVPFHAREKKMRYVLNNSFGFGGTNASLLFGKI